ncbi:hypothetical protein C0991_000182 [Blastosporella zonata]|nr:hypothetical protein C0991_000182 [Blastosporella zonata]
MSGVDGTHISIPLGIIIGLFASFVQSLGLTIQRKSHVLNQLLPEHQQCVEHRRPLWLLGFAIFISSNVIGSLVQVASLPVVILAPLGAVSLLWNAFFARIILGDVFSPWMILGTILIAGGAVLIAVFGIVPEPTRSLEDLLALFNPYSTHKLATPSEPAAALTTGLSTPIADAGISTEHTPLLKASTISSASSLHGKYKDADTEAINHTRLLLAISYSSFSGIISGMCLLFTKSGVELLLLTLQGYNQFWRWQAWVLVLGLIVFALLQLWYLHKALVLADPTLVCPCLVILGMSILLVGIWVVSVQSGAKEEDIETWSESDDMDTEETPLNEVQTPQLNVGPVPMERDTRSESSKYDLSRLSTLGTGGGTSPPTWSSPLRHLISAEETSSPRPHHRRRTTYDTSIRTGPPLLPINTLGTGFQIGLSPVSPGFAIQPRERGRRLSGRGVVDVVNEALEDQHRRRTVSEGHVRNALVQGQTANVAIEGDNESGGQGVTDRGKGKRREDKRRWDWLRRVIR